MAYTPNRSASLDWPRVRELRKLYEGGGWSQGRLSREYGISLAQVGRIVRYEAWQETGIDRNPEFNSEASLSVVERLLQETNARKVVIDSVAADLDKLAKGEGT